MGPIPPPETLPVVLRIPGGLNPERAIVVEGSTRIDAAWFSISLQCTSSLNSGDDIPFHLEITFNGHNTTYNTTSYQSGRWEDEEGDDRRIVNSKNLHDKLVALKKAREQMTASRLSLGVKVSTEDINSETIEFKAVNVDEDAGPSSTATENIADINTTAGTGENIANTNTLNNNVAAGVEIKMDPKVGQTIYECGSKSMTTLSTASHRISNVPITVHKDPESPAESTSNEPFVIEEVDSAIATVYATNNDVLDRKEEVTDTGVTDVSNDSKLVDSNDNKERKQSMVKETNKTDKRVDIKEDYDSAIVTRISISNESTKQPKLSKKKSSNPDINRNESGSSVKIPKHTNSKVDKNKCRVSYSKGQDDYRWEDILQESRSWYQKSRRTSENLHFTSRRTSSLMSILDDCQFGDEELHQLDLNPGETFRITLQCLENGYLVTLNEEVFCVYPHRTDYKNVLYVVIDGDIFLDVVEVGGGEGPERTLVMELYEACQWSGDVVVLTDDNFAELVLNSEERWMVDAYAAWCPACSTLHPEWEEAAKRLHGKVKLGASDCDRNQEVTDALHVLYYPMIFYFPEGPKTIRSATVYQGSHRSDCIVPWALHVIAGNTGMPPGIIPTKTPPRTLRKNKKSSFRRISNVKSTRDPTIHHKRSNSSRPWHRGSCGEYGFREVATPDPLKQPVITADAASGVTPDLTVARTEPVRCMLL